MPDQASTIQSTGFQSERYRNAVGNATSHPAFARTAITSPASKARSPLKLSLRKSYNESAKAWQASRIPPNPLCSRSEASGCGENSEVRRRYTEPYGDHHDN